MGTGGSPSVTAELLLPAGVETDMCGCGCSSVIGSCASVVARAAQTWNGANWSSLPSGNESGRRVEEFNDSSILMQWDFRHKLGHLSVGELGQGMIEDLGDAA